MSDRVLLGARYAFRCAYPEIEGARRGFGTGVGGCSHLEPIAIYIARLSGHLAAGEDLNRSDRHVSIDLLTASGAPLRRLQGIASTNRKKRQEQATGVAAAYS